MAWTVRQPVTAVMPVSMPHRAAGRLQMMLFGHEQGVGGGGTLSQQGPR